MTQTVKQNSKNGAPASPELPIPPGADSWPGLNRACEILNVPHSFITKQAKEGNLRTAMVQGTRRYDPSGLEELRAYVATADEAEIKPEPPAKPGISHEEFKAGTELIGKVLAWHERMFGALMGANETLHARSLAINSGQNDQISRQNERIAKLEGDRDQSVVAREKMLSEENERRIMLEGFQASERRKDRVVGIFSDRLVPLILKKAGLDQDPKVAAGFRLLASLKREQLMMLIAIPDVVSTGQREEILKLLGELSVEEKVQLGMAAETPQPAAEKTP